MGARHQEEHGSHTKPKYCTDRASRALLLDFNPRDVCGGKPSFLRFPIGTNIDLLGPRDTVAHNAGLLDLKGVTRP